MRKVLEELSIDYQLWLAECRYYLNTLAPESFTVWNNSGNVLISDGVSMNWSQPTHHTQCEHCGKHTKVS